MNINTKVAEESRTIQYMSNIGQRLAEARANKGWSQEDLAMRAGVSQGTIGHLESGRNSSSRKLAELAAALGVTAEWLATGKGDRDAQFPRSHGRIGDEPTDDCYGMIPQLDVAASCGRGRFVDTVIIDGGLTMRLDQMHDLGINEKSARVIKSSGMSMWPTINDGSRVIVNLKENEPIDNRIYAIYIPGDGLVIKRLVKEYSPAVGAVAWIMRSDNPNKIEWPDRLLPPDPQTTVLGRAVWNDNRL
ncbi:XRE family transcriptional regulator [Robbsia andropogonis]|uniref:XRE family transcriptional regulator n=1 Tax=Robbsia andropogonis TaxID=28092 RepID=UPI003D1CF252